MILNPVEEKIVETDSIKTLDKFTEDELREILPLQIDEAMSVIRRNRYSNSELKDQILEILSDIKNAVIENQMPAKSGLDMSIRAVHVLTEQEKALREINEYSAASVDSVKVSL
jgi:hypothetical protein